MQKILPAGAALIPDNATCAYQGEMFSVYTWPQTMFDGTTQQFEMLKRPDTVKAIIVKGDQLLLVNEVQPGSRPVTQFPGGRVEPEDESWLTACQREILEETGLTLATWKLIDVQQPMINMEWFGSIFVATDIVSEAPAQLDAGEKIEVIWRSFDEVRSLILAETEPTTRYLIPLFNHFQTLEDLLNAPEFSGKEVDR